MFSCVMGAIVSLLEQRQSKLPPQSNSQTDTTPINGPSNPSTRPSHISFSAQPPIFGTLALSPSSSPSPRENPFERPLLSPTLTFYTAPSTPLTSPQNDDPPPNPPGSPPHPEVVLHVPPPPTPPSEGPAANQPNELDTPAIHDDAFPNVDPLHVDPFLDDDGLSSLEKIYLFSRSQATFHRCVFYFFKNHFFIGH
jgi:serine/threonine-protein phosphatase 4 regulatory subunit 1